MRVLHVDTSREWRGGQTQLWHLARGQGEEAIVALPPDAPLALALRDAGVSVAGVDFRGRLRGRSSLAAVVRRHDPDLVAVHTSHGVVHCDRLAVPVVVHRRLDFVPSRSAVRRLRRGAGTIAVSGAVATVLGRVGVPRVVVVHDGVGRIDVGTGDPRQALGLSEVPVVVAVGALVGHKGHAVLVEALAALPAVHAVVLGEGPLRGRLARHARRLGVGSRLHLLGHRTDVAAWRRTADVVVHPSLEEGLGQAVVEAILQGAAVVASRAGGIPEIVEGSGLLVAPGDPDALARALRTALSRPADLRARAIAAKPELEDRFGTGRMVRSTLAAYARFALG